MVLILVFYPLDRVEVARSDLGDKTSDVECSTGECNPHYGTTKVTSDKVPRAHHAGRDSRTKVEQVQDAGTAYLTNVWESIVWLVVFAKAHFQKPQHTNHRDE